MRYISAERVAEGMILGKPFYGNKGELMLQAGIALTAGLIKKIQGLQYPGLYIEDEFSEGIEVEDVISAELRSNTTMAVRRMMLDLEMGKTSSMAEAMAETAKLLDQIIDEIISSEQTIVNLIDIKTFDSYTFQHSVNVCVLSGVIGAACKLARNQIYSLVLAAVLHDIGKVFIPKEVLNKPGKLTAEEFEIMKEHPLLGYRCIKEHCYFPSAVYASILQHHERHDGSGYPLASKGAEIALFARIIAVSDVYDAITSKRPYHEPVLPSEAYEYILGNSGQHFNPEIVEIFTKKIAPFPLGISVQLSNGQTGIIYKNYEDCLARPLIKLDPLPDQPGEHFLNLKDDPDALSVTIQKVLS